MSDTYPDMDEMIKKCEARKSPGELMVFGFVVGRIAPMFGKIIAQRKAIKLIRQQKGFIGVAPIDLWHNILLYESLNDAKEAKNELKFKGVSTGGISPILVLEKYVEAAKEWKEKRDD